MTEDQARIKELETKIAGLELDYTLLLKLSESLDEHPEDYNGPLLV